eukprot:CAMPEP_0202483486 /NCGR_PEP_ID=MMETSP1361-20130828/2725_1 /ASSEMBLY_ACC=CAM_ASM_000849 /TAXON_ID=210615 /ORGANISM="Staurosira complex sp., Strain CCMP2646" /LENGTH=224 /DNA_ID=CAMNT_0049111771 /DNA_START=34 /DNA_END=708 /DNA_ORIENTATION=-
MEERSWCTLIYLPSTGWNQDRDSVPELLRQKNVPMETWQSTFDGAVWHRQEVSKTIQNLELTRKIGLSLSLTILVCWFFFLWSVGATDNVVLIVTSLSICIILALTIAVAARLMIKRRDKNEGEAKTWNEVVETQQEIYSNYGITVRMMKGRPATYCQRKLLTGALYFQSSSSDPAEKTLECLEPDIVDAEGLALLVRGNTILNIPVNKDETDEERARVTLELV